MREDRREDHRCGGDRPPPARPGTGHLRRHPGHAGRPHSHGRGSGGDRRGGLRTGGGEGGDRGSEVASHLRRVPSASARGGPARRRPALGKALPWVALLRSARGRHPRAQRHRHRPAGISAGRRSASPCTASSAAPTATGCAPTRPPSCRRRRQRPGARRSDGPPEGSPRSSWAGAASGGRSIPTSLSWRPPGAQWGTGSRSCSTSASSGRGDGHPAGAADGAMRAVLDRRPLMPDDLRGTSASRRGRRADRVRRAS